MQLDPIKAALTSLWISGVCTAGITGDVKTLSGWTLLASLAVLPPLVMLWRWSNPRPTMSERIQEALR
jgi:hypothetical protein